VVRADGKGRVPAVEVLVGTGLIRECIKEADKTSQIPSVIAAGHSQYGMQTFDQSLLSLYRDELITYEVARDAATNPDDFDLKVKGIFSTGEMTWETSGGGQQSQPGTGSTTAARPAAAPQGTRPPTGSGGPFSKKP
jgi:twitching motility protein PilT